MFGRGTVELNPRKFWSWFASEAQGIANALEALQRGEADAEWAILAINARIRRFNASLTGVFLQAGSFARVSRGSSRRGCAPESSS